MYSRPAILIQEYIEDKKRTQEPCLELYGFGSWRGLEKLPQEIGQLQHVTSLKLSYFYSLREIVDDFFKLQNLEELYLEELNNVLSDQVPQQGIQAGGGWFLPGIISGAVKG